MAFTDLIANQLGISTGLLIVILIWSTAWKLLALWKSARKSHLVWFIVLGLVNLVGILEILYIFVFSEMGEKTKKQNNKLSSKKKKK